MTPASACPTFRAQPAPVQRLVPEGRRVTPGCCWPWSAAWHDVEPAVRARRPGTREYPAPADDAPSDSGARAGTTPYRRSSGCGPQRPPARTTSGTPYTAASIGSRLSSRKCPRARLAPSRHPAAGSTRPPPDRASRRAAPDTLGSTSAAVPRRSSGATGPEFRRSLDPGHAAAKGNGTSFYMYVDGEGNLSLLRVQRTGRLKVQAPAVAASYDARPQPIRSGVMPAGSIRRLVVAAIAEIAFIAVLGTALTAFAFAR